MAIIYGPVWALGCLSRHNEQSRAWISEVGNDYSAHAFFVCL